MTLFKQHAKTVWVSVLVWSLLIDLLALFTPTLWEQFRATGFLEQMDVVLKSMPDYLHGFMSGDVVALNGLIRTYAFGSFVPMTLLVFTGLFVVDMVTREMDRRTMEFLLALPVARWEVILSRWLTLLLSLAALLGSQWLCLVIGVRTIGQEPSYGAFLLVELNALLLYLAVGSLLLALSILIDDYGRGLGVVLGGSLGLYLFYMTTEGSTGAVETLRNLLPFALYDPAPILSGGAVPWGNMALLAAIAGAGLGLSVWLFQRKQITV